MRSLWWATATANIVHGSIGVHTSLGRGCMVCVLRVGSKLESSPLFENLASVILTAVGLLPGSSGQNYF